VTYSTTTVTPSVIFLKKYRHLLGDDDYKKIVLLTKDYTGAKALSKPEKG
jgi:hypothetical protein